MILLAYSGAEVPVSGRSLAQAPSVLQPYDIAEEIVNPNETIPPGYYGNLIGNGGFGWQTDNCAIDVRTNGFVFTLNSGDGNPLNYSGVIDGSGSVVLRAGPAGYDYYEFIPIILSGNRPNRYTGVTTSLQGVVQLAKPNGVSAIPGDFVMENQGPNDELKWAANDQIADSANLTIKSTGGKLTLAGHQDTIHDLKLASGATIDTGSGGQLTMTHLWYNSRGVAAGVYTTAELGYVQGSGRISVLESSPDLAGTLQTRWTNLVPDVPLPEYPRPQLVRADWQNLNGTWQFSRATAEQAPPFGQELTERILVPFPVESYLSGLQRHEERMWYRRTFTIPTEWRGRRIQLNFGAVDWQATVYVNGALVGTHQGGYDAFAFDITRRLKNGVNELVVGVYDPTDGGSQPRGKQISAPSDIFYTATSGIWQTVWLEPTAATYVTKLNLTPDLAGQRLQVLVQGVNGGGKSIEIVARSGDQEIGRTAGVFGRVINLAIPNPHLWSPDDPFLYDLQVIVRDGATTVDTVTSYFGMRSIGLRAINGVLRPVLNDQFVFQIGTLDQGFWPDGLYTAPTDEALRFDLEQHKALGFNMVRKHIKVEPQRWFYWADKLGLLVWQDMPAMFPPEHTDAVKAQFESELQQLVDEHLNAPSLIMWVVFNEGWGSYDRVRLANLVKGWDPSRLVNEMSGITFEDTSGNGDVIDWHPYWGLAAPTPTDSRIAALGEMGGYGLYYPDHAWSDSPLINYSAVKDAAELTSKYVDLIQQMQAYMFDPGLSAAVYTQITDVENEVNGLLTYDRALVKPDANQLRAVHEQLIDASRQLNNADIFSDDFEGGTVNAWSASVTDGGDLSVNSGAALVGTYGMNTLLDDNTAIYVLDNHPTGETGYEARFRFDPNRLQMATNDSYALFYGYTGLSTPVLRLELRFAGQYQLRVALRDDGTTWRNSAWFAISDAPHQVQLDWWAATANGANNGALAFRIDNVLKSNLTGVDNDTRRLDRARLGAVTGIDAGTRGNVFFDEFESTRLAAATSAVMNENALVAEEAAEDEAAFLEVVTAEELAAEIEETARQQLFLPLVVR